MKRAGRAAPVFLMLSAVFLLVLLTKNTDMAADGIKKGLAVIENILLPTLFPLLVISELFVRFGLLTGTPLLPRFCQRLLGVSREGGISLALGWLLGAPMGALLATADLEAGRIEKSEHCRLVILSTTPSLGFLVGAVGGSIFGSQKLGVLLYGASLFTSLLLTLCSRGVGKRKRQTQAIRQYEIKKPSLADAFTLSVKSGAKTFLQIAAFVLTFQVLTAYLAAMSAFFHLPAIAVTLFSGFLELTAGVTRASAMSSPENALLLIAFFAGFSGLSIILQALSVSGRHAPKLGLFLGVRLLHGVLTTVLVKILLTLTQATVKYAENGVQTLGELTNHPFPIGVWLLLFLLFYLFFHRILTRPLVYFSK